MQRAQEAAQFSAWGKIEFHAFPPKLWSEILPQASEDARDLVSRLIRYESGDRLGADAVSFSPERFQAPSLFYFFFGVKISDCGLVEHGTKRTDIRGPKKTSLGFATWIFPSERLFLKNVGVDEIHICYDKTKAVRAYSNTKYYFPLPQPKGFPPFFVLSPFANKNPNRRPTQHIYVYEKNSLFPPKPPIKTPLLFCTWTFTVLQYRFDLNSKT